MSSSDGVEELHSLAQAAGISYQWRDHRGELKVVAPEVLRAVLQSLELPAASASECNDSLDLIRSNEQRKIPSLITGRSDQQLMLPFAMQQQLATDDVVQLRDDNGKTLSIRLQRGASGGTCIPSGTPPGYYTLEAGSVQANLAIAPSQCHPVSELTHHPHNFGIAAQIYSLRSSGDGGIGNFSALEQFACECAKAGAQAVAMSPVHALFSADETRYSPYAPSSRLFLNALYIDPAAVLGRDLVNGCIQHGGLEQELNKLEQATLIDWPSAARAKLTLLRCIWKEHGAGLMSGQGNFGHAFSQFREAGGVLLEQHAIFEAIHGQRFGADPTHWHWRTWPESLQNPSNSAVKRFAEENRDEVGFHAFLQWLAAEGLLRAQHNGREAGLGIGLIADLAIGTDSGGSHAWSRQSDMLNGLSVGAPPDLINHSGQNWGLTTFSPRALAAHDYQPFLEMLRASLRFAGGLRIDHVLGLRRLWLIPEGAKATEGAYLSFPQTDLLNLTALESWRHDAIIIGEDLGTVPEGFREEISDVGVLGMQVLWFEKEGGLFIDPSRWRHGAMATTTTHDLPTVAGWWQAKDIEWSKKLDRFEEGKTYQSELRARADERKALWAAFDYAGVSHGEQPASDKPGSVIDSAIEFVASSPSPLTLIPVEDIIGLDEQPNLPGTIGEHPNWCRRLPAAVSDILRNSEAKNRLSILRRKLTEGRE